MTGVQVRLLLMVAKDMRRMMEMFEYQLPVETARKRRREYDRAIDDVEREERHAKRV